MNNRSNSPVPAGDRRVAKVAGVIATAVVTILTTASAAQASLSPSSGTFFRQGLAGMPGIATADDLFAAATASGDFNGDGRADLAIGTPGEDVAPTTDSGQVTVIYGTETGLATATAEVWSFSGTVAITPGSDDELGAALASGDFDGDGFDDLAVGAPGFRVVDAGGGIHESAGAVLVLYGSDDGLSLSGNQLWRQSIDSVSGVPEGGDNFGSALAAGDFDGNGRDDLAIGVPLENVGAVGNAGAVNVIYGTPGGLSTVGGLADQIFTQGTFGLSAEEQGDLFGRALATGDFDGDGRDDLAIAAPFEDSGAVNDAGAVTVVYGSANGLGVVGVEQFTQSGTAISSDPEVGDSFGYALAAGDVNGDGVAELAIGSPGEEVTILGIDVSQVGLVHLVFGVDGAGLSLDGVVTVNRVDAGGTSGPGDSFGSALALADFDGDGFAELAVGAPGVGVGGSDDAGAAYVFPGVRLIGTAPGAPVLVLSQDAGPGTVESDDRFGGALTSGDFDGSGSRDLAVGVAGEDFVGAVDAGALNVFVNVRLLSDDLESGSLEAWSIVESDG